MRHPLVPETPCQLTAAGEHATERAASSCFLRCTRWANIHPRDEDGEGGDRVRGGLAQECEGLRGAAPGTPPDPDGGVNP